MASNPKIGENGKKTKREERQLIDKVPIAEVNCENLDALWPQLMESIQNAHLVGIDLELSGLGHRGERMNTMPERYKQIRETTRTRSILSIGIAAFQFAAIDRENKKNIKYKCKIFDLLSLEENPFVVEPEALQFLSSHGFDFNRLLSHGIRYSKKDLGRGPFHSLWEEILASGVSVAFHNGLVDLAFLHEHFYSPLPEKHEQFVANIADWFGERTGEEDYHAIDCALWDSKYMALNQPGLKFSFSYLDYVFRKAQRDNQRQFEEGKLHLAIKFSKLRENAQQATCFSYSDCALKKTFLKEPPAEIRREQLCNSYTQFGHCRNRVRCCKEHDTDLLLDLEERQAQKKREHDRKRQERKNRGKNEKNGENNEEKNGESSEEKNSESNDGMNANENGVKEVDQQKETEVVRAIEEERIDGHDRENGRKRKWNTENVTNSVIPKNCNYDCASTAAKNDCTTEKGKNGGESSVDNLSVLGSSATIGGTKALPIWKASRGRHRAGMDAFMAGFSVLFFQLNYAYANEGRLDRQLAGRLSLPEKEFPLLIRKANFVTQTESHQLNWTRLESRRRAFDRAKYAQWKLRTGIAHY